MPTPRMHLAIANRINEKLNMNLDLMIGSELPDLSKNHDASHFQNEKGNYEERLANPDLFLQKYRNNIEDPIMMGYLIHLLSDKYYNDYYFKNHCILDEKGYVKHIKLLNGKVVNDNKKIKHDDCFKYDGWLLRHNQVPMFSDIKCDDLIPDVEELEVNKESLINFINWINRDKRRKFNFNIKKYKIMNKSQFDMFMDECCNYIFDYLNTNKLLKNR